MADTGHLSTAIGPGDPAPWHQRDLTGVCQPWADPCDVAQFACDRIRADYDLAPDLLLASNILWRLAGRQRRWAGLCRRCVNICRDGSCGCEDSCKAGCKLKGIKLSAQVWAVEKVTYIDDAGVLVTMPATEYELDAHRRLVRVDREAWPWEKEHDLTVCFFTGRPIDLEQKRVAAALAAEFAAAGCGQPCTLSGSIRQITRQGETVSFKRLGDDKKTRTGVPIVDTWLESVNPKQLQRRATVRRLGESNGNRILT